MTTNVQPAREAIGRTGFYPFNVFSTVTVKRGAVLTPCRQIELGTRSFGKRAKKKPSVCVFAMPMTAKIVRSKTLTNARLKAIAATHRPPQSWYEEDLDGI